MGRSELLGDPGRLVTHRGEDSDRDLTGWQAGRRSKPPMRRHTGQAFGHHPRRGQQLCSAAAGDRQRDLRGHAALGRSEAVAEVVHRLWISSPEAIDGLVRVADHHEIPVFAGEKFEQIDLGGVDVLVLVDEDPAQPTRLRPEQPTISAQFRTGAADQLGRVVTPRIDGAGAGQRGYPDVLLQEVASHRGSSRFHRRPRAVGPQPQYRAADRLPRAGHHKESDPQAPG